MALVDSLQGEHASQYLELYQIQIGQTSYFYTSYEKDYTFASQLYEAIPIEHQGFSNTEKMQPTSLKIDLNLSAPATSYIANSPVEPVKVTLLQVLKSNPSEADIFYQGGISSVELTKSSATLNLELRTDLFRKRLPNVIYSSVCNNILFDGVCQLQEANFSISAYISEISGKTLVSSAFATKPNGYFQRGKIKTSYGDARMVTQHISDTITLQFPFDSRILENLNVTAVAGCNRSRSQCLERFNNLGRYVGMPEIPSSNPVVWGVK